MAGTKVQFHPVQKTREKLEFLIRAFSLPVLAFFSVSHQAKLTRPARLENRVCVYFGH
jgi:hypothetical protein